MNKNDTLHLIPVFNFCGWGALEWTESMAKGSLTEEIKLASKYFKEQHTLSKLEDLGIQKITIEDAIKNELAVLIPEEKKKPATEKWCVISPHSDDAALSIGGTLNELKHSTDATILTMIGPSRCAGTCPSIYGNTELVSAMRKSEDELYAKLIGASLTTMPIEDIEMYVDEEGNRWADRVMHHPNLYRIGLFTQFLRNYFKENVPDVIVVPLAIGAHCDHLTTHLAFRAILPELLKVKPFLRVLFYEDLPYCSIDEPALKKRLQDFTDLIPIEYSIDMEEKVKGVSIYRSQYTTDYISTLLKDYAEKRAKNKKVKYIERLWELTNLLNS